MVGIFYNPMLIIIALFIFLAASGEASQAQLRAVAQGTLVSDAMITEFQTLALNATVNDAVEALIRTTQTEFPIVDGSGRLRGVLTRDAMIKALKERGPETLVLEVMEDDIPTVPERAKLDTALSSLMQKGRSVVGVTDADGRLIGLLTVESRRNDHGPSGAPGCARPRAVGQSTAVTPQSEFGLLQIDRAPRKRSPPV